MYTKRFHLVLWSMLLLLGLSAVSYRLAAAQAATRAAAEWLIAAHQNADGGFSAFSNGADQAPSDVGGTVDALIGLAAVGAAPAETLGWLEANADAVRAYATAEGGQAGKLLVALQGAGVNAAAAFGTDFALELTAAISPTGQLNTTTALNQAWALLGLAAAGAPAPESAVQWLLDQQAADGSWDDGFGTAGNIDASALAVMALIAAGAERAPIEQAIAFLRSAQQPGGGWEYGSGFGPNANSTALAAQALIAAGEDVSSESSPWIKDGVTPSAALLTFQNADGAFQVDFGDGPAANFFATAQSLPALAGVAFPLPGAPVDAQATDEPTPEPTPTPFPEVTPLPTPDLTADTSTDRNRFSLLMVGLIAVAGAVIGLGLWVARGRSAR